MRRGAREGDDGEGACRVVVVKVRVRTRGGGECLRHLTPRPDQPDSDEVGYGGGSQTSENGRWYEQYESMLCLNRGSGLSLSCPSVDFTKGDVGVH